MSEPTMTRDGSHPTADLSAYIDGELDAARRAEVETHLDGCSSCAGIAADLRGLAGVAASLEDRLPATDLWPSIHERIAAAEPARVVPFQRPARRLSFTWTQLAAASIALLVLGGGSVWLAVSGRGPAPGGEPATVADRSSAPSGDAVLVADFADEAYDSAVADLETALEASRDQLDPETVRTIERNLSIIDEAIAETRRALASDPNSVYLSAHLAEQMQRKLDVLRTATTVANTSI
jgi:anti-sigma factor RsiW